MLTLRIINFLSCGCCGHWRSSYCRIYHRGQVGVAQNIVKAVRSVTWVPESPWLLTCFSHLDESLISLCTSLLIYKSGIRLTLPTKWCWRKEWLRQWMWMHLGRKKQWTRKSAVQIWISVSYQGPQFEMLTTLVSDWRLVFFQIYS